MKARHILFIAGTLIAAIFTDCGKYDDGPRMSLRTKKARITNLWKYQQVISGTGYNATSAYANSSIELKRDGTYIAIGAFAGTGTWQFAEKKEIILLTDDNGNDETWTILRLTSKELWVIWPSGGASGDYEFHLRKK